MSLSYALFNRPANADEFLDKVQREAPDADVEVYPSLYKHPYDSILHPDQVERMITVEADGTKRHFTFSYEPNLHVVPENQDYRPGYQQQVRKVKEVADEAEALGLNVRPFVSTKEKPEGKVPLTEDLYLEIVGQARRDFMNQLGTEAKGDNWVRSRA